MNFVTPEPIREVGDASALAEAEIAAVLRSLDRRRREAELSPAAARAAEPGSSRPA